MARGQTVRLIGPAQVELAHHLIDQASRQPEPHIVNVRAPTRTTEQNAKMWAMLSDVSRAKPEGRLWIPDTWKAAFMQSCGHQCQFAEGLDNSGPFPVGFRTSHLNKQQMGDLIEVIYEYGSRFYVPWSEPNPYEEKTG